VVDSIEFPFPKEIKDRYDFNFYSYKNRPLGEKANFTASMAASYDPDYIMFLDSDDVIDNRLMELYLSAMEKGHGFIGTKDLWFYSLYPRRAKFGVFGYWEGYKTNSFRATGMGKSISMKLLKDINTNPFNRRVNSGLDGTMRARISKHKPNKHMIEVRKNGGFCVDIKTPGNINGISNFPLEYMDAEQTMTKHLPKEEVNAIMSYAERMKKKKAERNRIRSEQANLKK